jgi:ATP-dependent exoDNAse (exonuclease V) alpha subunit
MTLTDEQREAFDDIIKWVTSPNDQFYVLKGFAGTGKTTLLISLAEYVQQRRPLVYGVNRADLTISAPTNKAVKVIRKKLEESGLANVETKTIHGHLAIKPFVDYKTGEETYIPDKSVDQSLYDYNFVIIDEASMINKVLYEDYIKKAVGGYTIKILFVGDPAQLPPIKEVESLALQSNDKTTKTLTNVVRYGNEIGRLATDIRENLDKRIDFEDLVEKHESDSVILLDRRQFTSTLNEYFLSDDYSRDEDFCRILAYTNINVSAWNTKVRGLFVKEDTKFVIGDKIIANEACLDEIGMNIILPNSEEAIVTSINIKTLGNPCKLDYYELGIRLVGTITEKFIRVIHEAYEDDLKDFLKKTADKKDWKTHYKVKKFFNDISYSHSLTVHKSQGSTFANVFIDMPNIARNSIIKERNQLLYVAITRASKKVFIRL